MEKNSCKIWVESSLVQVWWPSNIVINLNCWMFLVWSTSSRTGWVLTKIFKNFHLQSSLPYATTMKTESKCSKFFYYSCLHIFIAKCNSCNHIRYTSVDMLDYSINIKVTLHSIFWLWQNIPQGGDAKQAEKRIQWEWLDIGHSRGQLVCFLDALGCMTKLQHCFDLFCWSHLNIYVDYLTAGNPKTE